MTAFWEVAHDLGDGARHVHPLGDLTCQTCAPTATRVCFCGQPDDRDRVHRAHECAPWSTPAEDRPPT